MILFLARLSLVEWDHRFWIRISSEQWARLSCSRASITNLFVIFTAARGTVSSLYFLLVALDDRSHRTERLCKNRRERREVALHPRRAKQGQSLALAFRRSAGTGAYVEIHEDSEHRRNARSRAQQIFSQALSRRRPNSD